jgi:hypothetical protein
VLEGELAHWAHTYRRELGPREVFGPEGRIGSVSGTTIIDSGKIWNIGMNLLLRSTGRVRVYGGGGASMSLEDSKYSQQNFGCSPGISCNPFVNARWRGPLPLFRALGAVAGVRFAFD